MNDISSTAIRMAKGNKGGKKKRRRRKKGSSESAPSPSPSPSAASNIEEIKRNAIEGFTPSSDDSNKPSLDELQAIASFKKDDRELIDLPDIKNVLKSKELKKLEEEEAEKRQRPRISRKDKKAFLQLLEEQPFADADDSYFEEEAYGTVSALLAEGARPFLGIPPGPLQVGHFIGALVIVLMAFVEYPGFPLTNLPTPLRDCFAGGLATIYLINAVLAVFAVFAAKERGQPSGLWAAKAFSVGGLAIDQLTQLPTLAQIEELENRKGARAVKKKK